MIRTLAVATILASAIALPALAQDASIKAQSSTVEKNSTSLMLTEEQAKIWIDKPVYSSDGSKLGEVASISRGSDNVVSEMHADIGGFLGMGETRVRLMPVQLKLRDDRVVLSVTAAEAKDLPVVQK